MQLMSPTYNACLHFISNAHFKRRRSMYWLCIEYSTTIEVLKKGGLGPHYLQTSSCRALPSSSPFLPFVQHMRMYFECTVDDDDDGRRAWHGR